MVLGAEDWLEATGRDWRAVPAGMGMATLPVSTLLRSPEPYPHPHGAFELKSLNFFF